MAQLIKSGKSNKEISQILNCSFHTVARHRDNIRAKTNLKNKKINLRSFLLFLKESPILNSRYISFFYYFIVLHNE
ncbi:helix-turn-helix transcriptional regulator [Desulfobacter hydrogenophilus]|uniref:helix-turn-helix transcriptional regulator n=1 Tax=Desulfobacter hydrogenophilus TaxID=2291 RepID=UPI001F5F16D2|nr:LuxR C-terminal-related transcriptional regulator [Desulfobacter hydrogenophilus]